MKDITLFDFDDAEIRTFRDDSGEPWFVAADVAGVLGYSSSRAMARSLDADEKGVQTLHSLGGAQEFTIISESGLYHAIFMSYQPAARKFRKWVTGELLPTLRKKGHVALKGSRLDSQAQHRSVGYVTLMEPLKRSTTLTDIEQRILVGIDEAMQAAGLPRQWEGVALEDPEMYRMTPLTARILVSAYGAGKPRAKVVEAVARLSRLDK